MFVFKKIGAGLCVSLATILSTSSFSIAQQAEGNVKASGWYKTCEEKDGNKFCNVQFRIGTTQGAVVAQLNLIRITGKVNRGIFQVIVPTARSLPQGLQVQIDGKKATAIPYAFCRQRVCAAEAQLSDDLIKILKAGGQMDITSLNYQGKPNKIPITLKGFTAAYDGEPVKPKNDIAENQEKLKKQLEEKLRSQQE